MLSPMNLDSWPRIPVEFELDYYTFNLLGDYLRELDSISEASELCWDKAFQAYGSTKSMLSGMKRPRWDVWPESQGCPLIIVAWLWGFWSKESTLLVLQIG